MGHDQGWVNLVLYSLLGTSLRSVVIIFPPHLHIYNHCVPCVQPYPPMYYLEWYTAVRGGKHHYTIIAFSVAGYV